jgi:polyisoprenoid-binding protein YceI
MTTTRVATLTARAYAIDKAHSEVTFQVRHLLTKVRGRFSDFSGSTISLPSTPTARSRSRAHVSSGRAWIHTTSRGC